MQASYFGRQVNFQDLFPSSIPLPFISFIYFLCLSDEQNINQERIRMHTEKCVSNSKCKSFHELRQREAKWIVLYVKMSEIITLGLHNDSNNWVAPWKMSNMKYFYDFRTGSDQKHIAIYSDIKRSHSGAGGVIMRKGILHRRLWENKCVFSGYNSFLLPSLGQWSCDIHFK